MADFALEINNLKKVYDKNVVALKGIDLKVKKGDFYALLGPNGAGKSSTIGIIGSLVTNIGSLISNIGFFSFNVRFLNSNIGLSFPILDSNVGFMT